MKRIVVVLVLLMTVSLVSLTGPVPTALADDSGMISILDGDIRVGDMTAETSGTSDGGSTGGDPDSLGDGHSRQLGDSSPVESDSGCAVVDGMTIEEFMFYVLSQIQLLAL